MSASGGDRVYTYWREAATVLERGGRKATAPDAGLQRLIEDAMLQYVNPETQMLDVGCGDGSSTRRFADKCARVVGVDYVQEFVTLAAERNAASNATYARSDVLDMGDVVALHGVFDVTASIRCLINLDSWEKQRRGMAEIAATLKPGGLYLSCEGWSDGLEGLNRRRVAAGLEAIPVIHHNTFMNRDQFRDAAAEFFHVETYVSFGLYLYLSRVVQPLAVRPGQPRYDHPINRAALELQACTDDAARFADMDYAGMFVLRKHG